jgi:hypothetical protein
MIEQWKPIKGYEKYYEVSNTGRIRSLPKMVNGRWGKCIYNGREVKVLTNKSHGYGQVSLVGDDGKKTFRFHRLVAEAFIENKESKPYINHIDCNKLNNHVDNLEWVTAKENTQHLMKMGRSNPQKGEDSANSKLSASDVYEIKGLIRTGKMKSDIARSFNVSQSTIGDIASNKTWKHL